MSQDPKVIAVLGSINIDLVSVVKRNPEAGETIHGVSFSKSPGGKGSNQAVACARLSRNKDGTGSPLARVMMFGCVGRDDYGKLAIRHLSDSGCDASNVFAMGTDTGVAVITVDEHSGENRIIVHGLANTIVTKSMFRSFPPTTVLMIMQLEIPFETVFHHAQLARKAGVRVMLNPSPIRELPDELLKNINYLVVNETEAAFLAGVPLTEKDEMEKHHHTSGENTPHPWISQVITSLLNKGCEYVVITLGKHGAVYGNKFDFGAASGVVISGVVDTTGAGDTFIGGLAVELVKNDFHGVGAAIEFANRAAAIKIQHAGAGSMPWRDEVESR